MKSSALKNNIPEQELLDILRLIRSENVGPVTYHALIARYGNAAEALYAIPELATRGGSKRTIKACPKENAEQEIEAVEKFGARMIAHGSADYPALLAQTYDAPPILTLLGNASLWGERKPVALVGARNASANGCNFAMHIARELGKHNIAIVSGLARGIDTAAHKASLDSGTVAVIAGGIDHIYPPENEALYKDIIAKGAVLSEQPFGAVPIARSFPARNRIIAGMSVGTVVVEASLKSGSLITAQFANEIGREVFAVPGSPMDPRCKGSNKLIREGATLTESIDDILPHLGGAKNAAMEEEKTSPYAYARVDASAHMDEHALEEVRARVLEKLGFEPVLVDELIAQCHVTPGVCHTILLELELAGRLTRSPGGRVTLKNKME